MNRFSGRKLPIAQETSATDAFALLLARGKEDQRSTARRPRPAQYMRAAQGVRSLRLRPAAVVSFGETPQGRKGAARRERQSSLMLRLAKQNLHRNEPDSGTSHVYVLVLAPRCGVPETSS